jgi:hypothetical protein
LIDKLSQVYQHGILPDHPEDKNTAKTGKKKIKKEHGKNSGKENDQSIYTS